MKARADKLFESAIEKLNQAKDEYYRPEEDMLTYLICKNAQSSIESFLKGYLLKNDVDPGGLDSLDALLDKCKTINNGFEKVDLYAFDCKSLKLDSSYCIDTPKVCNCLDASVKLENFLREEKVIA